MTVKCSVSLLLVNLRKFMVRMNKAEFINIIPFSQLNMWDVKRHLMHEIQSSFPLIQLSELIKENNNKVKLNEYPDKEFGILGVNNIDGLFDAYTEKGKKINQSYKKMETNELAYNPYRINVGSIGMKTSFHKNDYISPAYVVFRCNDKLNPEYLYKLFKTNTFDRIINENTTGSVRQNLKFETLKNIKIPLPPLSEQKSIIEAYNRKIKQAEELEKKAKKLEEGIEDILFEKLGLEKVTIKQFKKGVINLFSYSSSFDRWDMHKDSSASLASLKHAKYPVVSLNEVFNFEKRGWKKNEHGSDYFNYIELGAIDPLNGIIENKKIDVKKAPSRATQIIRKEDLIIGTTRPYLKKFAIVTEQFDENIASSGFQVISPSESYNLEYLLEYLKSDYGIKQFEFFMTGALYPAITSKDLKKIKIPIPPISIQNEISKKIKELKKEIQDLNKNSEFLKSNALKEFENEIFKP